MVQIGFGQLELLGFAGEDAFGEAGFLGLQLLDAFLDAAGADELVDEYGFVLADAVGAVGGLVLDRRVPPGVQVEDVSAAVRLRPVPPALREMRKLGGRPSAWKASTTPCRSCVVEPSRRSLRWPSPRPVQCVPPAGPSSEVNWLKISDLRRPPRGWSRGWVSTRRSIFEHFPALPEARWRRAAGPGGSRAWRSSEQGSRTMHAARRAGSAGVA